MSKVIKCDRCGCEIDPARIGYVSVMERIDDGEPKGKNPFEAMDFCPECTEAIVGFITMMQPSKSPVKKGPKKSGGREKGASVTPKEPDKKRRVDTGKICALANNNWPVKEIALDVGCSEQTVRQVLKEAAVQK